MDKEQKKKLVEQSLFDLKAAKKLNTTHQSAQTRGIEFAMTLAEVKRLLKVKTCYFTGVNLNDTENHPHQRSFDRIDNTKGYVNGNVVACSKEFNQIKGNLTIDQVRTIVKGFKKKKLW